MRERRDEDDSDCLVVFWKGLGPLMEKIDLCTKEDFDFILEHYSEFWPHDRARSLHHPIFLNEFGDTSFVVREDGWPIAYLFGFLSQTELTAYVHVVAVHPQHRKRSLAASLYEYFSERALKRGCNSIKAITSPQNAASIQFHRRIGFQMEGKPNAEGIPVVREYAGPGEDRVVFRKALGSSPESIASR